MRCFDDMEPLLAPALAQAAKDLADSRFTITGESVTTYIRQRRLEEARLALTSPAGRLSVSDLAAHWQFADSSHFIRTFKKHYGQTPTDHARSTPPPGTDSPPSGAGQVG
jgi:AraC family transcriptional regulator, positive regulator of tynA and feaB